MGKQTDTIKAKRSYSLSSTYIHNSLHHVLNMSADGLYTGQFFALSKPHINPQLLFANKSQL